MNERVCDLLIEGLEPRLNQGEETVLRRFSAFMDHSDCFMTGHARRGEGLQVTFSDDDCSYTFDLTQMEGHLVRMDRGEAFPWEDLQRTSIGEPEEL